MTYGTQKRNSRGRGRGHGAHGRRCEPRIHRTHPHALGLASHHTAPARLDGPIFRIDIFEPWVPALRGFDSYARIEVLYWLQLSRRDLVLQSPANDSAVHGTFSLRSPVRPNPIGTSIALLVGIEGATLLVRGLDCVDDTPLIDLKPDRGLFTPIAPPQPGDFEVGKA
jgi:tRNA (Thr-GGU) A37 N-methylase